jgi:hypothetical protein
VLAVITQATAAANGHSATTSRTANATTSKTQAIPLQERLAVKLKAARKYRGAIRFYEHHRTLLMSGKQRPAVRKALRLATRRLAHVNKEIHYYRTQLRAKKAKRLAKAPPRVAICGVFGRYCRQALSVAWCESRLSTNARNGQYLGLFQMGSSERRLFGHGGTAHKQAVAAHRYFVRSGRDWSPWSCRWAAS